MDKKKEKNSNLNKAKDAKNDEFYTRIEDIQEELYHYKDHFKDKVVFCNCDDPYESKFWFYFHKRFNSLGLKKLISTHYNKGGQSYKLEYTGGNDDDVMVGVKTDLEGDGDFRSEECVELLKESDIVVTNPPFSLARPYIAQLMEYDKKFLIISNQNALTYKEIFPLIKGNKVWIGYNKPKEFYVPEDSADRNNIKRNNQGKLVAQFGNIIWFTNMDIDKRHRPLDLIFFYEDESEKYPKYDNYDAIEVGRVTDIPVDYEGIMGVPITFLDKYCPEQFEILGSQRWEKSEELLECHVSDDKEVAKNDKKTLINGKETYDRIFIKNKNPKTKKEVLGL